MEKKSDELIIAERALVFQHKEKEKRVAELIISNIANTTERKQDEEYMGHLAAIVESSDDAIISKTLDGTIKSWNKGGERMFGYTAKEAVGKHISIIIPPEYITEERKIVEKIRNNEIINHYESVRNKKSGEHFYVSLTVSPLKDREGNIIGISKIARDITSSKKSEAEIIHVNKELNLQNIEKEKRAKELIIANKELASQNEKKEKRAAELVIANKELAFQNKEKEKRASELIIANIELAFQNEEKEKRATELIIANKELLLQNEEKGTKALELTIANKELAFQNEEKEKRAAELAIAQQKVIEHTARLEAVNNELEAFSYSISHDLRAPLRAVHGYSQILKEDYGALLDPEANRLTNNIMKNATKMGQLIDDLLSFSRLGRKELLRINIPMQEIVTNLCIETKTEQDNRNIQFKINKLNQAYGDSAAIKQVWVNLISNAVKYSRQKGNAIIEIGSKVTKSEIIYYIKDNGAGFDMRYANKLFGVFQRLHTEKEFEGTGVGLAIVQRIVSKHGGRVWAEAKVNEGAIFYFSLPKNTPS